MPRPTSSTPSTAAFARAIPSDERAVKRTMFGSPCCFVNGNMFGGVHGHELFLRLPEEGRRLLLRRDGASLFEPIHGRPMREYVCVPSAMLDNPRLLRTWVRRAFEYGLTLAPRKPRKL